MLLGSLVFVYFPLIRFSNHDFLWIFQQLCDLTSVTCALWSDRPGSKVFISFIDTYGRL